MQEPDVPSSENLKTRVELVTRWSDEDTQGVLNHAVYATLLEDARLVYFRSLNALRGSHFPFVISQLHLRFIRPSRGGERLVVELATIHLGRTSLRQAYRVRATDGEVRLEAEALLVVIDAKSGRSAPIPADLRRRIEECDGCVA